MSHLWSDQREREAIDRDTEMSSVCSHYETMPEGERRGGGGGREAHSRTTERPHSDGHSLRDQGKNCEIEGSKHTTKVRGQSISRNEIKYEVN